MYYQVVLHTIVDLSVGSTQKKVSKCKRDTADASRILVTSIIYCIAAASVHVLIGEADLSCPRRAWAVETGDERHENVGPV